ncbi:hypothetical protein [Nocardia sp. NPDC049149]|uniref:hypothetical protein n=1 Tax=Nocardia sp. NPDC049149 TaxID=3364315 RepID=UPI003716A747
MGKHSAPRKNHVPAQLAVLSTATLIGLGFSANSGAGEAVADASITSINHADHTVTAPAPTKRVSAAVGQPVSSKHTNHHSQDALHASPVKKAKPKSKNKPTSDTKSKDKGGSPTDALASGSAALTDLTKGLESGSSALGGLAKGLASGSAAVAPLAKGAAGSAATGSKAAGGLAPLLGLLTGSAM